MSVNENNSNLKKGISKIYKKYLLDPNEQFIKNTIKPA